MSVSYLCPDDLALCKSVLDKICLDLGKVDDTIRSEIAERILVRANAGECDFEALRACGLSHLGRRLDVKVA